MHIFFRVFANKSALGRKITLLVTLLAVVIFSVMLFIRAWQEQRDTHIDLTEASVREISYIKTIIDRPMNAGDNAGTTREFEYFAKNYPLIDMYMVSFIGEVSYSTKPQAVRKQIDAVGLPPELLQLARRALKEEIGESLLMEHDKRHRFARVISIKNEKQCYHCHGSSQPILGELIIIRDVTEMIERLKGDLFTMAGVSVVGLLLLLLALTVFVYYVISLRLQALTSSSNAVVAGDLNATFRVGGNDELTTLAQNLTTMVGNIKKDIGFSRGVMNGLTVPYLAVDTEDKITACNESLLHCFGHAGTAQDVIGMPAQQFLMLPQGGESLLSKAMRENKAQLGLERSFINKAGVRKHLMVDAVPLRDLDGKLIGAFTSYTDLTTIREQQQALTEQNERIAEATRSAGAISRDLAQASTLLSEQVSTANADAATTLEHAHAAVTSCGEMRAAADSVAENAVSTAALANEAQQEADQGDAVVQQAVGCIGEVVQQVRDVARDMQSLGAQAEDITRIISVIDEIADQTNLLALNAAIEAARAGDAGRGFAVVADEVRKLAEKTQEATRHVGASVKSILQGIAASTQGTDRSLHLVEDATGFAQQSGEALRRIQRVVEQTALNINAIASAAQQQSASAAAMAQGVDSINSVASNTAEAMQRAARAVEALSKSAHSLDAVMESMQTENS